MVICRKVIKGDYQTDPLLFYSRKNISTLLFLHFDYFYEFSTCLIVCDLDHNDHLVM